MIQFWSSGWRTGTLLNTRLSSSFRHRLFSVFTHYCFPSEIYTACNLAMRSCSVLPSVVLLQLKFSPARFIWSGSLKVWARAGCQGRRKITRWGTREQVAEYICLIWYVWYGSIVHIQQNGTKQNKSVCAIPESMPQLSFLYFLEICETGSMKGQKKKKINPGLCFYGLVFHHGF